MKAHIVDGKRQIVERGERDKAVAPVTRNAVSQCPAPVGGAGARVGQQGKFRGDGHHVFVRVEEHAGDFSAAAQRGIHDGGHCKHLRRFDAWHALPDSPRKRRGYSTGTRPVRTAAQPAVLPDVVRALQHIQAVKIFRQVARYQLPVIQRQAPHDAPGPQGHQCGACCRQRVI
ncbi:hypothetical protein G6F65_021647 [Rhizopus arrhizus]|nr:hypothetical protein G6F65_021647 [Rhizopus arrhizus]